MMLMGKKPEHWPTDKQPPEGPHELAGMAGGIVDGWNWPVYVWKINDTFWAKDDRGWFELTETALLWVAVEYDGVKYCIKKSKVEEFEHDPAAFVKRIKAAESNTCKEDSNICTVCVEEYEQSQ